MAELSPIGIRGIFAKNDQEITLEQAEDVLNLLKTLAGIAVNQTLRQEQQSSRLDEKLNTEKINSEIY